MNSAEQTVTWLITLGVLESPKKSISDPEGFLQTSLQDGAVLCRLLERLRPGTVDKFFQEPRGDSDCQRNIGEFIKGCGSFCVEPFEVSDLLQGLNFTKVLNCLVALNKATEDLGVSEDSVCVSHSSTSRIKSFDSLNTQSRSSKLHQPQYRSLDMSEGSGCVQLLVKARFPFQQTNEDELSFDKGDIISVFRQEDGGWWEGSNNGKTGWFPSNYVRELKGSDKTLEKPKSGTLKSPPKGFDTTIISKTYYNVVLQNILETETEYSRELQSLLGSYLRSLHPTDRLSSVDIGHIQGNLEEISTFQQMLVQSLEEHTKLPESQQRIGGFFLSLIPQMKILYVAYCSSHPSAVNVLTQHSEALGEYMESKGASTPGILTLTTSLSKPFTRLQRYPTLLKELDRHMEDQHPDRADLHASMAAFKTLSAQCQEVRKRKDLELQILTEPIRNWEGDDIRTLGPVQHMSQAKVHTQNCQESNERYLVLFPHTLLVLSASMRMSGFIYQGRMSLSGMLISRIEDGENLKNAFEISGAQSERMQVACNTQQELQEWLDLLTKHTHTRAALAHKHQSVCHTLPSHPVTPTRHSESRGGSSGHTYHTLPHPASYGTPHGSNPMWGPLEPPSTPKPWSLSCLRPAPPLRPCAALCLKEDMSKSPKNMKKLLPKRKPERKPSEEDFTVRKSTAALEEDAQILKVIEAYCTSAKTRQTLNSTWQGTDLMHNHVLADTSLTNAGFPGSLPCSDQSEDSDYESIWTAQSFRTASFSRSSRKDVQMLFPEEEKIIVEETRSNGQTVVEERSLVDTVYSLKDEVQELKQDNKRMKRTLEEEQRARKEMERVIRRVLKSMDDPTWDETNL
ncbi:rho guanine nucleotide exchange factor 7-like isoform X1 [Hippoglossus hippoglossus]|uniref:rho guanine nucleotide exchange factor 7-like isoform X1 n=1 Tax=Hippoglossus hippoglossus TaxID=8267 RepID=UPI00148D12F8|nr:rho guanine nucleotide exchange factor 7-like isoform X1 [Hippoglossus hippoglossus]XP_034459554.1 rho guanine nucleotide exchange factor 7-like isoform X1 [Hippoglossus hippoglossus]